MGNLADGGAVFGFGCHRIELECLMAAMTEGIVLRVLKRLTVAAPFMRVRPPRPTAMVLWTFYFLYYCCPSLSCHAIGLNWSDVLSLTRFAHTRNIVLPIEGFSLWHAFVVGSADGWTPSNNSKRIFDLLVLEKTTNLQAFIRRRDIVSERLQLLRFPSLFITHRSLYLLIYIYILKWNGWQLRSFPLSLFRFRRAWVPTASEGCCALHDTRQRHGAGCLVPETKTKGRFYVCCCCQPQRANVCSFPIICIYISFFHMKHRGVVVHIRVL